jgi:hypothetical protein
MGLSTGATGAALRRRLWLHFSPSITRINQRPFRKREGSRAREFVAVDKPALSPLPAERFDLSEWSRARVNIDYHIASDTNYYSVPYNLVHELVEVRSTPTTIEIFHKSQRVASHLRAHGHGHAVTIAETVRVPYAPMVFGIIPECRSASSRNERSA